MMKMMDGGYNNFNNYCNNEAVEEEEDEEQLAQKKSNHVPIWGNEKTMNLNTLVLTNIQSSQYFKVKLYALKTYHEVLDEIYYQVSHLEPWEKGSRKTAGQTGMCGGVRGVGAGGIVSTAFCILYKLFTLRLTRKQINGLINHADSPYIRGLGFMYIRYTQPPADLWTWLEPYMDDEEEFDVRAGGGQIITIGTMARHLLTKLDWHSTLFPRIPVPIQKDIEKRIQARDSVAADEAMRERLQQQRPADDWRKKEEDGRNSAASNSRGASRDRRDRPPIDAVRDCDRGSRGRDRVSRESDRLGGRSNGRDLSSKDIDRRSSDNNRNSRDTDYRSRDIDRRSKDIDRRSKDIDRRSKDIDRRSKDVDHRIKDSSRRSRDHDRHNSRNRDRNNSRNRDRNNSRNRDRNNSRDRHSSRDRERHNSRDRDRRSSRDRDRSNKEVNRRGSRDHDRNHRDINRRSSRDRDRRERDRDDQHVVSKHKRGRHDDEEVGNGRRRRDGSRSPRDFSADLQREQERIRTRLRSSSRSRSADRDRRHRR